MNDIIKLAEDLTQAPSGNGQIERLRKMSTLGYADYWRDSKPVETAASSFKGLQSDYPGSGQTSVDNQAFAQEYLKRYQMPEVKVPEVPKANEGFFSGVLASLNNAAFGIPEKVGRFSSGVVSSLPNADEYLESMFGTLGQWIAEGKNDDIRKAVIGAYRAGLSGVDEERLKAELNEKHKDRLKATTLVGKAKDLVGLSDDGIDLELSDRWDRYVQAVRRGEAKSPEIDSATAQNFESLAGIALLRKMEEWENSTDLSQHTPEANAKKGKLDWTNSKQEFLQYDLADKMRGWQEDAKSRMEKNPHEFGTPEYFGFVFGNTAPQMVAAAVTGAITRNPYLAASMIAAPVFGESYAEGREKGLGVDDSFSYAAAMAISEFLPQATVFKYLDKSGGGFLKKVLKGTIAEGAEEVVTEAMQMGLELGFIGENDSGLTWWQRLTTAAVVGSVGGGIFGAAYAAADKYGAAGVDRVHRDQIDQEIAGFAQQGEQLLAGQQVQTQVGTSSNTPPSALPQQSQPTNPTPQSQPVNPAPQSRPVSPTPALTQEFTQDEIDYIAQNISIDDANKISGIQAVLSSGRADQVMVDALNAQLAQLNMRYGTIPSRQGGVLSSTGPNGQMSGSLTQDEVNRVRDSLRKRIGKLADHINITDTLPDGTRLDQEGVMLPDGSVYINPAAIQEYRIGGNLIMNRDERIEFVAWHEMRHAAEQSLTTRPFGAAKLDTLLADARQNKVIDTLAKAIMAERAAAAQSTGYAGIRVNERMATQEALAELSAAIRTGNYKALTARYRDFYPPANASGIRKMVQDVADAIRKIVGKITGRKVTEKTLPNEDAINMMLDVENQFYGGIQNAQPGNGVPQSVQNPISGAPQTLQQLSGFVYSIPPQQSFLQTEQRYGGKAAYEDMRSKGETTLTYNQWVQVRTPEFKAWFGDWELGTPHSLGMDPVTKEPRIYYHGTNAIFDTFSYNFAGRQGQAEGRGFYFSPSRSVAEGYTNSGKVMEVFLNFRSPVGKRKSITTGALRDFIRKSIGENPDAFSNYGDVNELGVEGLVRTVMGYMEDNKTDIDIIGELFNNLGMDTYAEEMQAITDFFNLDSVIVDEAGKEPMIVVFNAPQIKSATSNDGSFSPDEASILYSAPPQPGVDQAQRLPSWRSILSNIDRYRDRIPDVITPDMTREMLRVVYSPDADQFQVGAFIELTSGNPEFLKYLATEFKPGPNLLNQHLVQSGFVTPEEAQLPGVESSVQRPLMAVHNTTIDSLQSIIGKLERGQPWTASVAVLPVFRDYTRYGDISLVIKPETVRRNLGTLYFDDVETTDYSTEMFAKFPEAQEYLTDIQNWVDGQKGATDLESFRNQQYENPVRRLSGIITHLNGSPFIPNLGAPEMYVDNLRQLRDYLLSGVPMNEFLTDGLRRILPKLLKASPYGEMKAQLTWDDVQEVLVPARIRDQLPENIPVPVTHYDELITQGEALRRRALESAALFSVPPGYDRVIGSDMPLDDGYSEDLTNPNVYIPDDYIMDVFLEGTHREISLLLSRNDLPVEVLIRGANLYEADPLSSVIVRNILESLERTKLVPYAIPHLKGYAAESALYYIRDAASAKLVLEHTPGYITKFLKSSSLSTPEKLELGDYFNHINKNEVEGLLKTSATSLALKLLPYLPEGTSGSLLNTFQLENVLTAENLPLSAFLKFKVEDINETLHQNSVLNTPEYRIAALEKYLSNPQEVAMGYIQETISGMPQEQVVGMVNNNNTSKVVITIANIIADANSWEDGGLQVYDAVLNIYKSWVRGVENPPEVKLPMRNNYPLMRALIEREGYSGFSDEQLIDALREAKLSPEFRTGILKELTNRKVDISVLDNLLRFAHITWDNVTEVAYNGVQRYRREMRPVMDVVESQENPTLQSVAKDLGWQKDRLEALLSKGVGKDQVASWRKNNGKIDRVGLLNAFGNTEYRVVGTFTRQGAQAIGGSDHAIILDNPAIDWSNHRQLTSTLFGSSHPPGFAFTLYHDFTDTDGKQAAVITEVQSDVMSLLFDERKYKRISKTDKEKSEDLRAQAEPFKKTWPRAVMRNAMRHLFNSGYKRIYALTRSGIEQLGANPPLSVTNDTVGEKAAAEEGFGPVMEKELGRNGKTYEVWGAIERDSDAARNILYSTAPSWERKNSPAMQKFIEWVQFQAKFHDLKEDALNAIVVDTIPEAQKFKALMQEFIWGLLGSDHSWNLITHNPTKASLGRKLLEVGLVDKALEPVDAFEAFHTRSDEYFDELEANHKYYKAVAKSSNRNGDKKLQKKRPIQEEPPTDSWKRKVQPDTSRPLLVTHGIGSSILIEALENGKGLSNPSLMLQRPEDLGRSTFGDVQLVIDGRATPLTAMTFDFHSPDYGQFEGMVGHYDEDEIHKTIVESLDDEAYKKLSELDKQLYPDFRGALYNDRPVGGRGFGTWLIGGFSELSGFSIAMSKQEQKEMEEAEYEDILYAKDLFNAFSHWLRTGKVTEKFAKKFSQENISGWSVANVINKSDIENFFAGVKQNVDNYRSTYAEAKVQGYLSFDNIKAAFVGLENTTVKEALKKAGIPTYDYTFGKPIPQEALKEILSNNPDILFSVKPEQARKTWSDKVNSQRTHELDYYWDPYTPDADIEAFIHKHKDNEKFLRNLAMKVKPGFNRLNQHLVAHGIVTAEEADMVLPLLPTHALSDESLAHIDTAFDGRVPAMSIALSRPDSNIISNGFGRTVLVLPRTLVPETIIPFDFWSPSFGIVNDSPLAGGTNVEDLHEFMTVRLNDEVYIELYEMGQLLYPNLREAVYSNREYLESAFGFLTTEFFEELEGSVINPGGVADTFFEEEFGIQQIPAADLVKAFNNYLRDGTIDPADFKDQYTVPQLNKFFAGAKKYLNKVTPPYAEAKSLDIVDLHDIPAALVARQDLSTVKPILDKYGIEAFIYDFGLLRIPPGEKRIQFKEARQALIDKYKDVVLYSHAPSWDLQDMPTTRPGLARRLMDYVRSPEFADKWADRQGELERIMRVDPNAAPTRHAFKTYNAKVQHQLEKKIEPRFHRLSDALVQYFNQVKDLPVYKALGAKQAQQVFLEHLDKIGKYVYHGRERNLEIAVRTNGEDFAGSGRNEAEIQEVERYFNEPDRGSGQLLRIYEDVYQNHLKPLMDYSDQILRDNGLLTPEMEAARPDYRWYVPLYGKPELEDPSTDQNITDAYQSRGGGTQRDVLQNRTHTAGGRHGTEAHSIFETVFTQAEIAVRRAQMQTAKKELWDYLQTPLGRQLFDAKIHTVFGGPTQNASVDTQGQSTWANNLAPGANDIVYQNGNELHVMSIGNPRALAAVKDFNKAVITNNIEKGTNWLTRYMGSMYTRFNPSFIVKNKFMDSLQQWQLLLADAPTGSQSSTAGLFGHVAAAANVVSRVPLVMKAMAYNAVWTGSAGLTSDYKQWLDRYAELGGVTTYAKFLGHDQLRNLQQEFLEKSQGAVRFANPKNQLTALGKLADGINNVLELTTRVSAFRALVESGVGEVEAANYVKDIMNFETKGEFAIHANAIWPFFTSSMYDIRRIGKALTRKEGQVVMLALVGASLALWEMLATVGGDDEDGIPWVDKYPMGIAARHFIVPIASDDGQHRGEGVRLPIGYGLGRLANSLALSMRRLANGTDDAGNFVSNIVNHSLIGSFSPLQPSDVSISNDPGMWMLNTFAPQVAKPIIQFGANKNWRGTPIYDSGVFRTDGDLDYNSGFAWTQDTYKIIAEKVYDATGNDISPESLQFWVQTALGGLGTDVVAMAEMIVGQQGLGNTTTASWFKAFPVLGGFIQTSPSEDRERYYVYRDRMNDRYNRLIDAAKRGKPTEEYHQALLWNNQFEVVDKQLANLRKQKRQARDTLKGEQLRTVERRINALEKTIQTNIVRQYEEQTGERK